MEERADSIKSNATQAMVKINTLEQENVRWCFYSKHFPFHFNAEMLKDESKQINLFQEIQMLFMTIPNDGIIAPYRIAAPIRIAAPGRV